MTLDDTALATQPSTTHTDPSTPQAHPPAQPVPATLAQPVPALAGGAPNGYTYPYPFEYPEPPRGRFASFVSRLGERAPWVTPAGIGVLIAGAISYTLIVRPTSSSQSTCLLHILTGFDCPGCGGTRAAWYLLHGDLPAAARHHAPFVFAVPFLLYTYVSFSLRRMFRWRVPRLPLTAKVLMIFMAVWLVYTVVRNLPWAPFTALYV